MAAALRFPSVLYRNLTANLYTYRDGPMADDLSRPAPASAQQPTPTEQRRAGARRRVLKSGAIEFGNEAIACTVRNLSPQGACIEVNSPLWFPDRFTLAVDGQRWPCRIAWKKQRRLGLTFE